MMALSPDDLLWDNTPREGDDEAVRALMHSANVFMPEEVRVAGELVQELLTYDHQGDYAFVFARVKRSKRLAGYACFGEIPFTDNRYDLYWIAVQPNLRCNGIGKELLKYAEKRIINSGGRVVYAEAAGRPSHIPARHFYLKHGFDQAAHLPDFYKRNDDKYIFSKRLQPPTGPRTV